MVASNLSLMQAIDGYSAGLNLGSLTLNITFRRAGF